MPRIIVMSDADRGGAAAITFEERVIHQHIEDEHSAAQLIERLGWAVADAEAAMVPDLAAEPEESRLL
jgi:hypothetical protein